MTLQDAYTAKAEADFQAITARVHRILEAVGRPTSEITAATVRLFCRNVLNLRCMRSRSVEEEFAQPRSEQIVESLQEPNSDILWYVISRGAEGFRRSNGRGAG